MNPITRDSKTLIHMACHGPIFSYQDVATLESAGLIE
jgi:hypothetical protein